MTETIPVQRSVTDRQKANAAALWQMWQQTPEPRIRERLIHHYTYLAKHVVDRLGLRPTGWLGYDDLVSHAVMGLIDAIEKFDPARGVRFETYAVTRIRGAVLDMLRALDWVPREMRRRENELKSAIHNLEAQLGRPAEDQEIADHLGWTLEEYQVTLAAVSQSNVLSLDAYLSDCGDEDLDPLECLGYHSEDPVRHAERSERRRVLVDGIEALGMQERTVVALYYFEDMTLKEIGAVLNVSESRVCQIHTKAIWRLQSRFERQRDALRVA
ncbi:MAG TPA: FliA/WhiG family RNA polymerase sigma factor [Armatimonadota bacterium]|jgi:RNA polymerase sigma factor for flagellar operon FliA